MSPTLFTTVDFNSEEAWAGFTLMHGISHQTTHLAMLAKNLQPDAFPMFDFPREGNQGYLLDHNAVHQSNARLLGLPLPIDLSTVDLSDAKQYQDWMLIHASIHADENLALGINV
jgi:hypothetical protein